MADMEIGESEQAVMAPDVKPGAIPSRFLNAT
jgi:hypothetical protein